MGRMKVARGVRYAEISAVVSRRDGSVEDLGILARYSQPWYLRLAERIADEMGMATLQVNTGRAVVTALLAGGVTYPKWVGWGDGSGTTMATDTNLFFAAMSAVTEARVSGTQTQVTTTTTFDTYQCVATLTANETIGITNAGIFDAAGSGTPPAGGNLYVKGDFAVINLSTGDSIQFTFKVAYS